MPGLSASAGTARAGDARPAMQPSFDRLLIESIQGIREAAVHPIRFLFEDIYRKHWGIPRPKRDEDALKEAPVRPRIHPLQRLLRLP